MLIEFCKNLKEVRKSRGLSQGGLAKITGLHPSAISHFEIGDRKPSFYNLVRLVKALNVSADSLLGIDTSPEKE